MDCKTRAIAKSFQLMINSLGLKMAVLALRSAIRANAMPLRAVSAARGAPLVRGFILTGIDLARPKRFELLTPRFVV